MSTTSSPPVPARARATYEFELRFRFTPGIEEFTDPMIDALFESGCGDGLVGVGCGVPYIAFAREAPSFRVALLSAIADVERADVGLILVGIEMQPAEESPGGSHGSDGMTPEAIMPSIGPG